MAGGGQSAADGHSAFGSWAPEQQGNFVSDAMRALRQPSKPPARSSGAGSNAAAWPSEADQPAEAEAPDEASDDDADESWWDTDLPGDGSNGDGVAHAHPAKDQTTVDANHEAAEAIGEYATGSLVWQREAVGSEAQASQEAAHSWTEAEQQPGSGAEAHSATGQQSGDEAAVPSADACSSAEEQWRLAYAQWYEAYMHWYASYTLWHAGYQQHCADQASGSASAQADHARQEHRQ